MLNRGGGGTLKISITTSTDWNDSGKLGAFFFVAAPIVGCLAVIAHLNGRGLNLFPLLVAAASSVGWSLGIVMMLNGRQFQHEVELVKDAASATPDQTGAGAAPTASTAPATSTKTDWDRIKSGELKGFGPGRDRG